MQRYNNDPNFALSCRMVITLAFVPVEDIDIAVENLGQNLPLELAPLLQWFEDNYVGRPNRFQPGRQPALFPPDIWTLYDRVLNRNHRTNNYAEASHRRIQVRTIIK